MEGGFTLWRSSCSGTRRITNAIAAIIDQTDDGEFPVANEDTKASFYQLASRRRGADARADLGCHEAHPDPGHCAVCRFCNICAVWLQSLTCQQVQDLHPDIDGVHDPRPSWTLWVRPMAGLLPGTVLRTTLIMLDSVSLSALHNYEAHVERLTRNFLTARHLIYSADELAWSAHSNRTRSKLLMELKAGKTAPANWDPRRPWDWVS